MTLLKIHTLKLRFSNAYLIAADRPILVDAGAPNETGSIRSKLQLQGVQFSDLSLIIHTHIHSDHMGSTAQIVAEADCPVAYHPADQPIADQSHNGRLRGVGLRGWILSRFLSNAKFDAVNADPLLSDGMHLHDYGVEARILHTPGHTAGSISIVTAEGDAIIGDVIMGGYLGGRLRPRKPNYHYFANNLTQAMSSLDLILSRTSRTLYVAHGGPLLRDLVLAWRRQHMKAK